MIKLIKENGIPKVGVYEIMVDTADEVEDLDDLTYPQAGSTALCIENSKTYMLNSSGEWTEVNFKKGGGSGSESWITKTIAGEFHTPATAGGKAFEIPYTGNGYPVNFLIKVKGGITNDSETGQSKWMDQQTYNQVGLFYGVKDLYTTDPSTNSEYWTFALYRSEESNNKKYQNAISKYSLWTSFFPGGSTASKIINFTDAVTLKANVFSGLTSGSGTYGLLTDTDYEYFIEYFE